MKQPKLLIVGFDIKNETSYAIGSISSYLQQNDFHEFKYENYNPSNLDEREV